MIDKNSSSLESYEKDFISLQNELPKLKETNPNQFVAFVKGEVISSGENIEEVKKDLISKNIEPSGTVIEFIPKKEIYMIV